MIAIDQRSLFTPKVFVCFLDDIWSRQKLTIDHLSDFDGYRRKQGTLWLVFWLDGNFGGVNFYSVFLIGIHNQRIATEAARVSATLIESQSVRPNFWSLLAE